MEIYKDIEIVDLGLKYKDYLIIGDLHIGLEEAMNKQGVLIPSFQFNDLMDKLKEILKKVKVKTIVINGDLKHEFGTVSDQEWRQTLQLIDSLKDYKVILIKGNHDNILGPIAKKRNIEVKEYLKLDDILITHGNEIKEVKCKVIIIGHEHPAVSIKSEVRSELYKCFLKGKWKRKVLIVMPSFSLVSEGSDVLKNRSLSPYIKNFEDFEVYAISDEPYLFGKVKDLE